MMASSLVSSFLIPLVKDGAEKLRGKLLESTTDTVADKLVNAAGSLWQRVRQQPRNEKDQKVLSLFEEDPDLAREAMERIVTEQLTEDQDFRRAVAELLEAQAQPGTANWQLMGDIVGVVDARQAHIYGGVVAGVHYTVPDAPPSRKPATPSEPAAPPGG